MPIGYGLAYPIENDPAYTARIRFTNYKIKPLNGNETKALREGLSGALKDNIGKFKNTWENFKSTDTKFNGGLDAAQRAGQEYASRQRNQENADKLTKVLGNFTESISSILTGSPSSMVQDKTSPMVHMFVPLSMAFSDTIQYEGAALGAAPAAFANAVARGDGSASAMLKGIGEGAMSAINTVLNGTEGMSNDAARLAASRTIQSIPLVKGAFGNAAAFSFQVSVNPNTRALFKGVTLREFTFNFNMIANSQREAEQIEAIVKHFRYKMYPSIFDPFAIEGNLTSPFAYKFPDLFKIDFRLGNTRLKVPKIHPCYLRNVQVTYNPTGATFHRDGRANETNITLSFMEFRALSQRDIAVGY